MQCAEVSVLILKAEYAFNLDGTEFPGKLNLISSIRLSTSIGYEIHLPDLVSSRRVNNPGFRE